MKRKEHPTNEESLCKQFNASNAILELDVWSVICEYVDNKSLVNLFCLSKEIQKKLIETFSSLVSNRIKDNKKAKIFGISSYYTMDPMFLLLAMSGPCFSENYILKNNGVQSVDFYSYAGDTIQAFGGLKFKMENGYCSFVDFPSIDLMEFIEYLGETGENILYNHNLEFMLFSLTEQIVSVGNFQLTERFKKKMEFMNKLYNYTAGDAYPQDHLIPNRKFQELFTLETWDLFECVKQDIAGIFVVNRVDYGLLLLDFFGKSTLSVEDEDLYKMLDWIEPTLGYAKAPLPLFTLILFTINALYCFYLKNLDTKNKKMALEYSMDNTNENINENIDTCKRIMRATNYWIIILKASNLYPQSLQFDVEWDFMEVIQEIKSIHQENGIESQEDEI